MFAVVFVDTLETVYFDSYIPALEKVLEIGMVEMQASYLIDLTTGEILIYF